MDINQFLKQKDEFLLGHLSTEGYNPLSANLSHEAVHELTLAINHFKQIDTNALLTLEGELSSVFKMGEDIFNTIEAGNKIFLVGCGATGRLALTLEKIFSTKYQGKIISFMAGGDYALIKSVESFEDETSYGPRQLLDLGFTNEDLVIGVTEAGETSFVIGAVMHAQVHSKRNPWIFFCNEEKDLLKLHRCKEYIENKNVNKLSINVGAMALSGSTRLQASSVQMLALGLIFEYGQADQTSFLSKSKTFIKSLCRLDYQLLRPLIEHEAMLYDTGQNFTYICDHEHAISILTDTTERSPTFNLIPFEAQGEFHLARCYLAIRDAKDSMEAWEKMLGRRPRAVEWSELESKITQDKIYEFDISSTAVERRKAVPFELEISQREFRFSLEDAKLVMEFDIQNEFFRHMCLKLLLNCHSTLVMGRVGRYQNNVMTWVRPSNMKLIDRATRYAMEILRHKGATSEYEDVCVEIYRNSTVKDKSIVLSAVESILKART